MPSPARGTLRALRAIVLGAVSLWLAAAAHAAGAGHLPGVAALAVLSVPVGCVAALVTGRRLRPAAVIGVLAVEQYVLHAAFMVLGAGTCHGGGHALHTASTTLACHVAPQTGPSNAPMVLSHIVATLLTAIVLAYGETLLWSLAERLAPRLPAAPVLPVPSPRLAITAEVRRAAQPVITRYPPRGPPCASDPAAA